MYCYLSTILLQHILLYRNNTHRYDHNDRLTAHEALQHPYFQDMGDIITKQAIYKIYYDEKEHTE